MTIELTADDVAALTRLVHLAKYAERIFAGWMHDENPHGDLQRGESLGYDAACEMHEEAAEAFRTACACQLVRRAVS